MTENIVRPCPTPVQPFLSVQRRGEWSDNPAWRIVKREGEGYVLTHRGRTGKVTEIVTTQDYSLSDGWYWRGMEGVTIPRYVSDVLNRQSAIDELREKIAAGDTIYTSLEHVSSSGMSRRIQVYRMADNSPGWITGFVAEVLDYRQNDRTGALVVGGCGMDMGFHVVYSLSRALFPAGFLCIGEDEGRRCPSNDHSNGDRNYTPHVHSDGGYALNHRWL